MGQEEAALKEWEARSLRPAGGAPLTPSRIGAQREASAAGMPRSCDP
jgi:hypothetical protein